MMDDQNAITQLKPRPSSVDYFNLDDILASQEKVPSKFELPVYRLGFLDTSTSDEHVPKGSKLDLPYWLSRDLCTRRRKIVSVEMPKIYGEHFRQIFKADANVLDLHKMGPYFYKFGLNLLYFEHVDAGVVARSLLQVFRKRFRQVMDKGQNAWHEDVAQFIQKLDSVECLLFSEGQNSLKEFENWKWGQTGKVTVSAAVVNHKKRKRAALESES